MTYYSEAEALDAAPRFFPIGGRWIKQVSDRRFEIEVSADGLFTEWLESAPQDTWQGKWGTSASWETPFYVPTVLLVVGDYEARLRAFDEDALSGYEIHRPTLDALPGEDRMHEITLRSRFPKVSLTRVI